MKKLILITCLIVSFNLTASVSSEFKSECKSSEVIIDELVRDSHIKGHVTNLPPEAYDKFKVVFYVKTNRWYVHPYLYYPGQEPGYSYSLINSNGEFEIKTLRRQVPSKAMAVVVVPKDYKIRPQKFLLKPLFGIFGGVLKNKCTHTIIQGNGDFFL